MGRNILIIIFLSYLFSGSNAAAQNNKIYDLFPKFIVLLDSGDFKKAEEIMLPVLKPENKSPVDCIFSAYVNLGIIRMSFGQYDEAIKYYDIADNLAENGKISPDLVAALYNNKARIYTFRRSYATATEYLEKAIRIYQNIVNPDKDILHSLSTVYLNIGIVCYESKEYKAALDFLNKSAQLKLNKKLKMVELAYLNLAKTYAKMNYPGKSEEYFEKCIASFKRTYGENYYRMADVYFSYGTFLREAGRYDDAVQIHQKALRICLKNYGEKHSLVSYSYKFIGDDYLTKRDFNTALAYYQKALIAIVADFNDPDINSNPLIDHPLFDIRLLDDLKGKAQGLELLAGEQNDSITKLKTINKSLETIDLALNLIDRIRNNFLGEESRIYLAENEKETYLSAIHTASLIYAYSGDDSLIRKMYGIAQKTKASGLYNEITGNTLFYSANIPDSLKDKQTLLSGSIAGLNNLIFEESRKPNPDSKKITPWKDRLFEMNREKEKITAQINREFPQYHDLLLRTEPVPLAEIQKHLDKGETVIDYLLSDQYKNGRKSLYTFLITGSKLEFRETSLDSLFLKNVNIIRASDNLYQSVNFRDYTGALSYMYENLLKPVKGLFSGNKLIIIPDEEITGLPFDAFLMKKPDPDQIDFEGLKYMIHKYIISYGYSSSLIFTRSIMPGRGEVVYAFSPDYRSDNPLVKSPNPLSGAQIEIESIYKRFKGKKFTGDQATKTNFLNAIKDSAIFHLAMHSFSDTINSKYSYLLFNTPPDSVEGGKLYNYEISLARINSPMVVLSACNSGTGTLYHSEGMMSLARGFILAGASSVIRTAWEVNDETSADLMTRFYYYLSKGRYKDEAMRRAKLDYLKSSPPAYAAPYYWAAYEVLGENSPIEATNFGLRIKIIIGVAVFLGILIFYLNRRRIFSDRSL